MHTLAEIYNQTFSKISAGNIPVNYGAKLVVHYNNKYRTYLQK